MITLDYLAKILHINRPENVDISPYDDSLPLVTEILDILGADHEVSSKDTSIGIAKFGLELKTLTLIMFFNLYPLSNIGFINLGRAQFLCDLIKGAQIDICAHIFQTMGKTTRRSAARMCLPFCSLVMKIMVLKGVRPPKEGTILLHQRSISMISLQMSKSHSFAERAKHSPSKTPKSESSQHATPSEHRSAAPTIPGQPETTFPHIPEPQSTSTQLGPSSSHQDKLRTLIKGLHERILGLANVIYSTTTRFRFF
ncbi:uncharacterized protein LOC142621016 [Castanea sativa]|uniref:uncharacterized protein LOC142621016 n=1 Tax=Castanea sativa TaxID=21020 RepID=UPI003F64D583